ncbi:hypothetical protein F1529_13115 [Alcanivorax sp. VBW004]|uniref:hypothetical protein n=1 Tax=Alcanivorax sp. VBW004 TaxID=1287708 RepID=UPI0012BC3E15|nr:hypothetical protein [Alcanivorax sp. VBW004]MTT53422.1 hypothetical protein [Alcanivorax sp. VBW004]
MRPRLQSTNLLLAATLTLGAAQAQALTELSDDSLSDVQGAGFAFALDNFSMRFAPESFIELTGATVSGTGWERGDARYYGLSMTNGEVEAGTDWYATLNGGGGCGGDSDYGNLFLACPQGSGNSISAGQTPNQYGIGAMASIYDPYVLRVYDYEGYDFQGNYLDGTTGNEKPTILELIGPSQTEKWRWSFWGELEVDRVGGASAEVGAPNCSSGGANCADFLQSQTIIHGKPTTAGVYDDDSDTWVEKPKPAILRLMQTANADDRTLGITYQSALSGDFRFSVRQKNSDPGDYTTDTLHNVPDFDDNEGLYFKNVDAFLPLGTLHYQAITLNAERESGKATGDFVIELTRIPNIEAIYEDFYCGGECSFATSAEEVITNPNENTRGYVRWGDFEGVEITQALGDNPDTPTVETDAQISALVDPNGKVPGANSINNGIYFVNPSVSPSPSDVTNIGISRIEGMRIHHMKITTLGANQ